MGRCINYDIKYLNNHTIMNSFLFADSAGPKVQRLYHQSHYVLAGLIPATLVSEKSSIPAKLSDIGLAAAIPVHSHIAMNYGAFFVLLKPYLCVRVSLNVCLNMLYMCSCE